MSLSSPTVGTFQANNAALWRRLIVIAAVRVAWRMQKVVIRLLPRDHEFRMFKSAALRSLDGCARASLGTRRAQIVGSALGWLVVALFALVAVILVAAIAAGAYHTFWEAEWAS